MKKNWGLNLGQKRPKSDQKLFFPFSQVWLISFPKVTILILLSTPEKAFLEGLSLKYFP